LLISQIDVTFVPSEIEHFQAFSGVLGPNRYIHSPSAVKQEKVPLFSEATLLDAIILYLVIIIR